MAEELNNVQHNLNADVDISFESGIESILRFAEQIESVNSVFSQLSFTAENLEDKIVRKFNELGNLLNDSKPIADVNEAVAKKIQHKINRYISQYVDNLSFSTETSRLNKQPFDEFNKNFTNSIDKFIREINTKLSTGLIKSANKEDVLNFIRKLISLRDTTSNLYKKIFNAVPSEERLVQLENIRAGIFKELDTLEGIDKFGSTFKQFKQQITDLFNGIISKYEQVLQSQTKGVSVGDETVISKTALNKLRSKIKQAILDSLDVKFGTNALSITIDKSSVGEIQKVIAEHFNEMIKKGDIQIDTDDTDIDKNRKDIEARIKEYDENIAKIREKLNKKLMARADALASGDPLDMMAYEDKSFKVEIRKLKDDLTKQEAERKKLVDNLSTVQSNVLFITNENLKKYWATIQNKFAELLSETTLKGLDDLEPIKVDKIKQVINQLSETINKSFEGLKIDKETLNKIPELGKSIEKFNTSISDIISLLSDLGNNFASKPTADFKKSLTKVNDALVGVKQQIDNYVIDYINKIIPENLFADGVTVNTDPAKKINKKASAKLKNLEKQLDELLEKIPVETDEAQRIELGVKLVELNKEIERLTASTGEKVLQQVDKVRKEPLISQNLIQKFVEKFSQELESLIDVSKIDGLNTIKEKIAALDKNFKELDQNLKSILTEKEVGIDKEIVVFKSNIEELGKNFENINALLKSADVGGLKSAIESLINGLNSLAKDINAISAQVYVEDRSDDRIVRDIKNYKYAFDAYELKPDEDPAQKFRYMENAYKVLFDRYIALSKYEINKLSPESVFDLRELKETVLYKYFNNTFEGSTYDLIERFKDIGKKLNPALYDETLKIDVPVESLYKTITTQINEIVARLTDILKNEVEKISTDSEKLLSISKSQDIDNAVKAINDKIAQLSNSISSEFISDIDNLIIEFNKISDLLGTANVKGLYDAVNNFVQAVNQLTGEVNTVPIAGKYDDLKIQGVKKGSFEVWHNTWNLDTLEKTNGGFKFTQKDSPISTAVSPEEAYFAPAIDVPDGPKAILHGKFEGNYIDFLEDKEAAKVINQLWSSILREAGYDDKSFLEQKQETKSALYLKMLNTLRSKGIDALKNFSIHHVNAEERFISPGELQILRADSLSDFSVFHSLDLGNITEKNLLEKIKQKIVPSYMKGYINEDSVSYEISKLVSDNFSELPAIQKIKQYLEKGLKFSDTEKNLRAYTSAEATMIDRLQKKTDYLIKGIDLESTNTRVPKKLSAETIAALQGKLDNVKQEIKGIPLNETIANIAQKINFLGDNFKVIETNLQKALNIKSKGLDVHVSNLPAIIQELGRNFEKITASLQSLSLENIQVAVNNFAKTLQKFEGAYSKKVGNVDISGNIENLNKSLRELQQEIRNSDNGITAARLIVDGINQKIEQFVKSLIALSAKIVNVDTATLSIKLTPEQLQSLEAQLEGVNIVNVNEISGPINTALKNLLGNAGKIIESQLSNIMNQEDIKIPKLQTKKIVSQLTTLVNTFMTGYVNAVAENSLIYKPLEIKTKDLPQSIKNALAKKAGVSLEDYLKRTPTIGGATVLAETLEQNMGALSAKLHEAAMNNENRLFSEYKNAIKGIKVKVDTSPVEYFTNNITSIQQEIIAKIKEIMRVQFSEINKQIKELKAVPVGFNYVPKNIPSTIPVKTATVQSYGAKVNIPRGTVNIPVPYRVGDDLDFTTIYQKAGGLGSHVNNRTLLNSILNTMRYILAGSLLKGPYAYLYQGWESAKDFEASLVKAQINLSGSNEELFRDFARTRIEKAVELGVTNALSHLKGITDTEAMVDAEVAFLKKYVTEDVRKDLQNISLRYIISQAQLGQMFEIASRSTTDPFEARAITETAARLFAAEPGVGSPEEIADALQASIVQMGMTGFDTKRLSEIFFNISTNFRVSTKDLLKFTATAGAVMSDELKNYQTEELAKLKQEIESATGSRRKELEERYKQVKLDTDIALTGLIGALITEGSNKTGTEAARMMIQFFNSLNTPETRKLLEDIAGSNPKYASILPYKYTPNQEGLPFTEKTSGIESFFTILKLANEMESQGDARLAGEMLRKVFGRYTGAGKAVDKMIEIIMQRFPEYRKEGKDPVQGIIEDFKKNSDLFMEEAIAKNNMTLAKRTERAAVTWEAAMSNVFMEFKDDISFAMDAITNILRIIRDNADFVAGLIKNLINILIGAGVRHYGGKLFDKINANVLASERDLLVEPWKQKIKEDIKQRAEMQKDLLNYDEKLSKAVNVYESARQAYFNLTGVNLGDVDEKNQPQFTNKSVREILNTSDDAVERALLALYSSQIDSEKASRYTIEGNNIGFNMYDAKILSKFAEKLKSGNKLSPDEIRKARQRLLKYSGQLSEFGPELFDSDTDIALVTGQSTGDGGIIGRLKAKASMLEENLQMFKNDNILLNVVGGSISGILPRSKEELLTRANKYIQSLESLVDEDDDIAMLKQLLDNEQEDSKEYAKLVEDINKRRSQVETSLGIPRLKEALEAYKSSEIDFESVANTIKEFEDNLQKIKSGIPVNRVEAESEEQENLLRLKALREAYVTLYGEDATNDKKLNNINQRISMSQRRLEKIKSGQFTNSEIEQLVDQLNGMKQFNVTPENYGDMVETLNQIKAAVAVYEDEAEKILNKATRAASTISELSLGKGKHVNKLAELDTAIAESHNVVKNIIEAYSNMGAAPRIEKGKSTIGGLKDTKLLKTIDNLKQGYIKTIAEMVPVSTNAFIDAVNSLTDRMFNKKILGKLDEEQVEKAILKAMGGDYTEADKLFGEKSKDIVLGYEEINTGISNAKKLVDNLSKQKQIIQEISKLRESDELKNYKDYITDKGEIYEEKFYSDKIPGYSLDKSDDENIKKQTQILKSELDSIGKTQAGQKLLELRKQLNNLTGEADALANASRRAAQGQAQLSDATKRLVTEHELGVTKDSEFIEALKKEQGSKQQSPMQLALGSLVGSVASIAGNIALNWVIGEVTTFAAGRLAQLFESRATTARLRYERASDIAQRVDEIERLKGTSDGGWDLNLKKSRLGWDMILNNIPFVSDLILGKRKISEEQMSKIIGGKQSRVEALAELKKQALEEEYLSEKTFDAVNTEIFKKLNEAVRGSNNAAIKREAELYDTETWIDFAMNRLVGPEERDINYESLIKKLELRSKGFRDTSQEMINIEVQTAKKLADLYEKGAAFIKAKMEIMEKNAEELGTDVNTEAYLKLKENYLTLKEKAAQAQSIVSDVFSQINRLFADIEADLSNALIGIDIADISSKIQRWRSGIPEYSGVAINQQISVLQSRVSEYKKAEEEERQKLARLKDDEKNSGMYKDLETKYKSTVEKRKQAEYDLVVAMQQLPISSAETLMNMAAATADVEARIALAKAQLKGLGEDSLYARLMQKQRLEKINEAYGSMIAALNEQYNKKQGDYQKIWIEMKELEAKQLENLVAIKKLNENKISFNLPDGLRVMTYNDYLQSTGNERSFTSQFKAFNLNINFGDVTVRSDNDIKNIVRSITNQVPIVYKNGLRIR
jgi:hypothetical protein